MFCFGGFKILKLLLKSVKMTSQHANKTEKPHIRINYFKKNAMIMNKSA